MFGKRVKIYVMWPKESFDIRFYTGMSGTVVAEDATHCMVSLDTKYIENCNQFSMPTTPVINKKYINVLQVPSIMRTE